ncbi:MAG: hypothetical protein ABIM40_13680, partial [Pseudomonadota bacterium]
PHWIPAFAGMTASGTASLSRNSYMKPKKERAAWKNSGQQAKNKGKKLPPHPLLKRPRFPAVAVCPWERIKALPEASQGLFW